MKSNSSLNYSRFHFLDIEQANPQEVPQLPSRAVEVSFSRANAYKGYAIPVQIRPSLFPYFLNSAKLAPKSPSKIEKKQAVKKGKQFVLKLPNKAFKIKNWGINPAKTGSSSVLEKLKHPLNERLFSAVKKTVPLEQIGKESEVQETLSRVLKKDENLKKESFLRSPIASFSPVSGKKARRETSPNRLFLKGLNSSQFSMKSSLMNLENYLPNRKANKQKDKAFLDLYLNSFDESPNNKMKGSRLSSPLILAPSFLQKRESLSPDKMGKSTPFGALKLNKVEFSMNLPEESSKQDQNQTKPLLFAPASKKRTDHNFLKILVHYWKYDNKVPKNRPPAPAKKIVIWNRKINFVQVRKSLLDLLTFLAKTNVTLAEFRQHKIFPDKPFENEGSYIFMKAVKYGNFECVRKMIEKNKYYTLEFDYMEQTGLHWTAIKGHEKIAIFLIEKGSLLDHLDKSERPPLYYAIRNGNYSIANVFKLLLSSYCELI